MEQPYTYQVWAYVEVVDGKGTSEERFIENLVGPIKLVESDSLQQAMLELWAFTNEASETVELDEVMSSADRIEEEIAEGKYEWTT
jgi:hypothetical protein